MIEIVLGVLYHGRHGLDGVLQAGNADPPRLLGRRFGGLGPISLGPTELFVVRIPAIGDQVLRCEAQVLDLLPSGMSKSVDPFSGQGRRESLQCSLEADMTAAHPQQLSQCLA